MYEDLSRLLGLESLTVKAVVERGGDLDLEVEIPHPGRLLPVLRAGQLRGEGAPRGAGARPADCRQAYLLGLAQAPLSLLRLRDRVHGATRETAVAAASHASFSSAPFCSCERGRRARGGCSCRGDEPLPGGARLRARRRR